MRQTRTPEPAAPAARGVPVGSGTRAGLLWQQLGSAGQRSHGRPPLQSITACFPFALLLDPGFSSKDRVSLTAMLYWSCLPPLTYPVSTTIYAPH